MTDPTVSASPLGREVGEVITFYSYKGGVGRSMAVANVGAILAARGERVLLVDFDLEAPGLHRYLRTPLAGERAASDGVVELLASAAEQLTSDPPKSGGSATLAADDPDGAGLQDHAELLRTRRVFSDLLERGGYFQQYALANQADGWQANLSLLAAGRFDADYPSRVRRLDWAALHELPGGFFRAFALELASRFDYVLVDSRTGITDVGGVCTVLLPEKLVVVFTPNEQALHGAVEIGRQAVEQRIASDDGRPLPLFPLLSRLENAEDELHRKWTSDACARFERVFQEIYAIPECDLSGYFRAVQIPHKSIYAFGELIAAERESLDQTNSLAFAFARFVEYLKADSIWDAQSDSKSSDSNELLLRAKEAEAARQALEHQLDSLKASGKRYRTYALVAAAVAAAVLAGWLVKAALQTRTSCLESELLASGVAQGEAAAFADLVQADYSALEYHSGAIAKLLLTPASRKRLEACTPGLVSRRISVVFAMSVRGQTAPGVPVRLDGGKDVCFTDDKAKCSISVSAPVGATNFTFTALQGSLIGSAIAPLDQTGDVVITLAPAMEATTITSVTQTDGMKQTNGVKQTNGISGGPVANARNIVAGLRAGFKACYQRGLTQDPDAHGQVQLLIRVGSDGKVANVDATVTAGGQLPETVVECLKARAKEAKFDAPEGGSAVVKVPVSFIKQ